MLQAKCQDHGTSGFKGDDLKMFYHIWVWRPSWSYAYDHLRIYTFVPLFQGGSTREFASIGQLVLVKMFQNNGQIAMGEGQTNPWSPHFAIAIYLLSVWLFALSISN